MSFVVVIIIVLLLKFATAKAGCIEDVLIVDIYSNMFKYLSPAACVLLSLLSKFRKVTPSAYREKSAEKVDLEKSG